MVPSSPPSLHFLPPPKEIIPLPNNSSTQPGPNPPTAPRKRGLRAQRGGQARQGAAGRRPPAGEEEGRQGAEGAREQDLALYVYLFPCSPRMFLGEGLAILGLTVGLINRPASFRRLRRTDLRGAEVGDGVFRVGFEEGRKEGLILHYGMAFLGVLDVGFEKCLVDYQKQW